MYRDKGSPCLIPLEGSKDCKAPPLTKTNMLVVTIQLIMILVSFGGNGKLLKLYAQNSILACHRLFLSPT